MRLILLSALALLSCAGSTFGQVHHKWSATIALELTIKDDTLKAKVQSYLSREFRALGDVTVVEEDSDSDYVLKILCFYERKNNSETPIGYIMSALVVSPLDKDFVEEALREKTNKEYVKTFKLAFKDYVKIETYLLYKGPEDDLPARCKELVAKIDSSVFDPVRKYTNGKH